MAVESYVLNGPRDFYFPHPVRVTGDLTVEVLPGGVIPLGSYEVIGAGPNATGVTVRYPTAPTDSLSTLRITRFVQPNRLTSFSDVAITATALNAEFDNAYQAIQDFTNISEDSAASAAAAANSAAAAQAAAVTASNTQTTVQALLDSFEGLYYGPAASDPTLDPNGNPPGAGDVYYNTAVPEMRVYNGTAWAAFLPSDVGAAVASHAALAGNVHGVPSGEAIEWQAGAQAKVTAHANLTDAHGATENATANTIMRRGSSGRAKVAAPLASDDIARKDTVDNHANLTSAHGATSNATANRIILRDAAGRAKVTSPSAADDIATKGWVEAQGGPGIAKAWVVFNGASTPPSIISSFNVSSITDNGAGNYTINFTNPLPNANYVVSGSAMSTDETGKAFIGLPPSGPLTTSACKIRVYYADSGNFDSSRISAMFHGG